MKTGDYVRTKSGYLRKIIAIYNGYVEVDDKCFCSYANAQIENDEIVKTSPNIIDLIEIGDYVNGAIVTKVVNDIECNYIEIDYSYNERGIRNKDIKSIVTKEQFESMEYKIEV